MLDGIGIDKRHIKLAAKPKTVLYCQMFSAFFKTRFCLTAMLKMYHKNTY